MIVLTGEHLGLVRLAFFMVGLFGGAPSRVGSIFFAEMLNKPITTPATTLKKRK